MKIVMLVPALFLASCLTLPEQKLGDGQSGCITITSMYGKGSSIVTRADNVGKGASNTGKTVIKCGDAVMEIDTATTTSTTTTTTVTKPVP